MVRFWRRKAYIAHLKRVIEGQRSDIRGLVARQSALLQELEVERAKH